MTPALTTALALLASLGIAVVVFVLVVWLVFRWLDVETFGPPITEITTEPDPIESYPPPVVGARTTVWVHHPGEMPVPLNPIGPSEADMRVRS